MSRARTSERVDAFERHQFRDGAHLQMYVEQWCHDKPETLLLVKGDVLLDHPSGRGMQVPITNEAWSLVKAAPDLKSALTAVTVDVDGTSMAFISEENLEIERINAIGAVNARLRTENENEDGAQVVRTRDNQEPSEVLEGVNKGTVLPGDYMRDELKPYHGPDVLMARDLEKAQLVTHRHNRDVHDRAAKAAQKNHAGTLSGKQRKLVGCERWHPW